MSDKIGEISKVVKHKSREVEYCFGSLSSDKLKALTFVPILDGGKKTFLNEDTTNGYQRQANKPRMAWFTKYLLLPTSARQITPPILLSGRDGWQFVPDANGWTGKIVVTKPAAIIDGQHRAGGYVNLYESTGQITEVAFILLNQLSLPEEIQTFITVNNTAKGVTKSTTAYLAQDKPYAEIAWQLNEEQDSPFVGRISRGVVERYHLFALHSVAKEMERLFSIGAVQDLDTETKTEYASRFFNIVAETLEEIWQEDIRQLDDPESRGRNAFTSKLLELTGLSAWCYTGAQILSRSYNEFTGMNWENVERLIRASREIDWDKSGQYLGRTGLVGAKAMSAEMIRLLPAENSPLD